MKWESDSRSKHGCCNSESRLEPVGLSRAWSMLDQQSSTTSTPHSPLLPVGNQERRAVEAYKLQVEQRRSMAIELARRNTYR